MELLSPAPAPLAAAPKPGRVPLAKQSSEGTLRLNLLRRRLEELETLKSNALLQEEAERKRLRDIVTERYDLLRTSIDHSLQELRDGLGKLPDSPSAEPSPPASTPPTTPTTTSSKPEYQREETFEPSAGRDAALALAWIDRGMPPTTSTMTPQLAKKRIRDECAFLERQALAAKIMANVSLQQKKLLNLSFSWLRTFLPHCLAKINRVSFGLLTEEDCAQVLRDDPMVPRSRLKLAVPFVGKDVPSTSSEFAHPDIILGLTILAYRYSGLRRSDFDDVVDALTAEFSREIGPAKDRASSRRHEQWVLESGGTLRGVHNQAAAVKSTPSPTAIAIADEEKKQDDDEDDEDSREVVQLKFLTKSNQEQMDKLFALWKLEPHCIHHYLGRFIFPAYMRHQRSKISASGQSVGGDMLFGKRVGFSGTPSDLLPRELGKCSYEMGDEGKMLSTVLDSEVTSYEHLAQDWTVEALLDTIATARHPTPYHALIDTGALVTGYSNQQVAEELLRRGLGDWCDGVVFLDENDMKKVLVKDTGRVVPADQCGIPLERRFAFYDQIHTTGMDIQHVVNARACVTLGKDLVLRDLLQGVYRMRGIGTGQSARIFITPEVGNLIKRELKAAASKANNHSPILRRRDGTTEDEDTTLTEIVAWLVINSMRSEMTQWSMLCLQNVTNVYRKNAFRTVLDNQGLLAEDKDASAGCCKPFLDSLAVFDEPIDFSLDSTVPDPVPFATKLRELLDEHGEFVHTAEERAVAESVLDEVSKYAATDGKTMERLDSEQEREQEQEQEKEVRSKREQEIEIEKFVDREYTRSDETQRAWHVSALLGGPQPHEDHNLHPFFPLSEFKLRYGEPLHFPNFLACSRNYFNPNWTGLRRVKNVVMALEYCTDNGQLDPRSARDTFADSLLDESKSGESFDKAFTLLATSSSTTSGALTPTELQSAIRAATDVVLSAERIDELVREYGTGEQHGNRVVDRDGLKRILTSGTVVREVDNQRFFVAVSLSEAETLRRIIHMQREGDNLLGSSSGTQQARASNVQVALRYIPVQTLAVPASTTGAAAAAAATSTSTGLVFDASRGWREGTDPRTGVSEYQALAAHSSLRFLDCAQHFTEPALNVLVRCLQRDVCHARELFFQSTIGARRRMERKWQETPLSKLFTMANEWSLLKLHATAVFIRQALKNKGLFLYEAYTAFDFDDNGVLTPAEFYGAMRFLGLPNVTADDVVDMIEAADRNDDGVIDYREYLDMLKQGGALAEGEELEEDEEDGDGEDDEEESEDDDEVLVGSDGEDEEHRRHRRRRRRPTPGKVEPFGADQLREIMGLRRRETAVRQRKDRARRQAYQQAVDIKVFEAELKASRDRKGGSNPSVLLASSAAATETSTTTTVFRFNGSDAPIRMQASGKWKFAALRTHHSSSQAASKQRTEVLCSAGHVLKQDPRYWDSCVMCGRMQTKFKCQECAAYMVCQKCHSRCLEDSRRKAEDISDKLTYAHVFGGASFSLQVPSASLGLSVSENEDDVVHAVDVVEEEEEGEGGGAVQQQHETPLASAASMFEVKSERFSVTLEVRFEVLPPRGQCAALVRFFPTTFGRSRSRHLASAYLTHAGRVVGFDRIGAADEGGDGGTLVQANKWHVITLVSDAHEGTLRCYVDGQLSSQSEHLDADSLTLRHQLVVLGGGKQAQSRGGHVHRLIIHNAALTEAQAAQQYRMSLAQLNTHVVWYSAPGAPPSEQVRKDLADAGFAVTQCHTVAQLLASVTPQTKCFVASLGDRVIPFAADPSAAALEAEREAEADLAAAREANGGEAPPTAKLGAGDRNTPQEILASLSLLAKLVRMACPNAVVVCDTSRMTAKMLYRVGERVSGRWNKGAWWYPCKITRVNEEEGTYDALYDDGGRDTGLGHEHLKPTSSIASINSSQLYVQERAKQQLDGHAAHADQPLRDKIFACEIDYLKRTKN